LLNCLLLRTSLSVSFAIDTLRALAKPFAHVVMIYVLFFPLRYQLTCIVI